MKYVKQIFLVMSFMLGSIHSKALLNSQAIPEEIYPGVVSYIYVISGDDPTLCTASFVSSDTLLTAKHCISDLVSYCLNAGLCDSELSEDRNGFAINFPAGIETGISLDKYPSANVKRIIVSANPDPSLPIPIYDDLAFIKLEMAIPNVSSYAIALKPDNKMHMTSVGYGNNSTLVSPMSAEGEIDVIGKGYGTKRWAKAPVGAFRYKNGTIFLIAPAEFKDLEDNLLSLNVLDFFGLSSGDSGGPLFKSDHKIIGIASEINRALEKGEGDDTYFSYYTDLTSEHSQFFLAAAKTLGAVFRVK